MLEKENSKQGKNNFNEHKQAENDKEKSSKLVEDGSKDKFSKLNAKHEFEYPESFEFAHKIVAEAEGGLVEHKNDPGGLTKFGISLRFLEDFEKTKLGRTILTEMKIFSVERKVIVSLTKEQAKKIMYHAFWLSPNINKLPLILSIITYDYAVNSGSFYAVKVLQKAVGAKVDGILGSKTRKQAFESDVCLSAKNMLEERAKFYIRLSKQKPKLKVFLKGWLNRVEHLKDYLNSLSKSRKAQKIIRSQAED